MSKKDDLDLLNDLRDDDDFQNLLKEWGLNPSYTQNESNTNEPGIEVPTKSGNIVAIYPKSKRIEVRETDKLWEITGKYFQ